VANERLRQSQEFFATRAAGWEDRFPQDGPAYEQAVAELAAPLGATVLDAACGTGRALPMLRAAVGAAGQLLGVDVTAEMLAEAALHGRSRLATLVRADVTRLPIAGGSCDAIFAAGILSHLADPAAGLRELARVARIGARLAIFHPIGRAALAAKHGHQLRAEDVLTPETLRGCCAGAGWTLVHVVDAAERYLAIAVRG
jgi:SAM-dependent methyltransferase